MKIQVSFSFLSAFIGVLLCSCSAPDGPVEPVKPNPQPVLSVVCLTGEASAISGTGATLNGAASIKGASASSGDAYFYYSETLSDPGSLKSSGQRINAGSIPSAGGDFSASVSNLKEATEYNYIASVSIDGTEVTGNVKTFKTTSVSPDPESADLETDITGWEDGEDIQY